MREKLLELLKREGLKPSQLAEILEINPAGISHILAGRNKPSFELLQKILRRFPRINPDWLLLDSDQIYRNESPANAAQQSAPEFPDRTAKAASEPSLFSAAGNSPQPRNYGTRSSSATDPNRPIGQEASSLQISAHSKSVRRIVIFYDDLTFEDYIPTDK